jgi:hypothetical protein
MSAGARLGTPGRRHYRRLEITVKPPTPDREKAIFVMRQTDVGGNELSEAVYESADDAIGALIKVVGEQVVNVANDPDDEGEGTRPSAPVDRADERPAARVPTLVLVVLLGILALFAGWFVVTELQAVPDNIADKGVQAIGSIGERLMGLLEKVI